jgi:cholesterol transport system auxiliary component
MNKGLILLMLSFGLSGCVNIGDKHDGPAMAYYVLNDAAPAYTTPVDHEDKPTLRVLDTTSGGFYDTDQLVFSRSPGTRSLYQFARWTEQPGKRFADLMRARLDRQGAWKVSDAGGYVRGDRLLDTELVEFYHDAASEPGQFRLVLRAELIDLKKRSLLGRRVFEQQVPLTTYDAAGAARASSLAVARVLDDLSVWLATFR